MRAACALVSLAIAACGAEPPTPRAAARPPRDAGLGGADASSRANADAGSEASRDRARDRVPNAAQIAARGAAIAPSMRESARVDADAPLERELVRSAEQDTCARVAFAAAASVRVVLAGARQTLIELPPAESGVAGPACVRKGDAIVLRIVPDADAGATAVHAVAWISP